MRALFDEADSLGAVLSGTAIRGVEAFNDEFNKLQTLIGGISNQFVAALAPALTKLTQDFTYFLKSVADANGGFENLGEFLKDEFIDILIAVTRLFATLINSIVNLGRSIPGLNLFPIENEEAAKKYEETKDAVSNLDNALKVLTRRGSFGGRFPPARS